MISFKHFCAVLIARNKEFLRDRSSWAWNVVFPILLIAGLSYTFGNDEQSLYKVGVFPQVQGEFEFFNTSHIDFIQADDLSAAITKVERHQYDLLLDVDKRRYWTNDTSARGYIVERVLFGSMPAQGEFRKDEVSGAEVRYVDWVIPGILGMNMMFSCLFGVGYVIVRYRKSGVLKRLKATPLNAVEFLAAQVASRLWLVMAITLAVFFGTHLFIKFVMHGSYLSLLLVLTLGSICLINMGLLVAARTASEELAGGLLNLATWPMMFLSGVWFSLEGAHPLLKSMAQVLPLTHIIDACRAIMIDGASLLDVGGNIIYLIFLSVFFLVLGAKLFRWE